MEEPKSGPVGLNPFNFPEGRNIVKNQKEFIKRLEKRGPIKNKIIHAFNIFIDVIMKIMELISLPFILIAMSIKIFMENVCKFFGIRKNKALEQKKIDMLKGPLLFNLPDMDFVSYIFPNTDAEKVGKIIAKVNLSRDVSEVRNEEEHNSRQIKIYGTAEDRIQYIEDAKKRLEDLKARIDKRASEMQTYIDGRSSEEHELDSQRLEEFYFLFVLTKYSDNEQKNDIEIARSIIETVNYILLMQKEIDRNANSILLEKDKLSELIKNEEKGSETQKQYIEQLYAILETQEYKDTVSGHAGNDSIKDTIGYTIRDIITLNDSYNKAKQEIKNSKKVRDIEEELKKRKLEARKFVPKKDNIIKRTALTILEFMAIPFYLVFLLIKLIVCSIARLFGYLKSPEQQLQQLYEKQESYSEKDLSEDDVFYNNKDTMIAEGGTRIVWNDTKISKALAYIDKMEKEKYGEIQNNYDSSIQNLKKQFADRIEFVTNCIDKTEKEKQSRITQIKLDEKTALQDLELQKDGKIAKISIKKEKIKTKIKEKNTKHSKNDSKRREKIQKILKDGYLSIKLANCLFFIDLNTTKRIWNTHFQRLGEDLLETTPVMNMLEERTSNKVKIYGTAEDRRQYIENIKLYIENMKKRMEKRILDTKKDIEDIVESELHDFQDVKSNVSTVLTFYDTYDEQQKTDLSVAKTIMNTINYILLVQQDIDKNPKSSVFLKKDKLAASIQNLSVLISKSAPNSAEHKQYTEEQNKQVEQLKKLLQKKEYINAVSGHIGNDKIKEAIGYDIEDIEQINQSYNDKRTTMENNALVQKTRQGEERRREGEQRKREEEQRKREEEQRKREEEQRKREEENDRKKGSLRGSGMQNTILLKNVPDSLLSDIVPENSPKNPNPGNQTPQL